MKRKWLWIAMAAAVVLAAAVCCIQLYRAGSILQAETADGNSHSLQHVGLILSEEDSSVSVLAVMEDSIASRGGLQPGDTICAVDDTAVKQIAQVENALMANRGKEQTVMTVLRDGEELALTLSFRRSSGS